MWNWLFRRRQQQQGQGFRFTVVAPQTRGQDETMALRDNVDDLGATAALQQVIDASRPRGERTMSSQTTSLHVTTRVSAVSEDSEEFIRNEYTDSGRRPRRQEVASPSSPLAVTSPVQATGAIEDDYVDVERPDGGEADEQPGSFRNFIMDPVGTLLHTTAAATLASGTPGRQYITSGPPPPYQRGRRPQSSSEVRPLLTPRLPRHQILTQRARASSEPAYGSRPRMSSRTRSLNTL